MQSEHLLLLQLRQFRKRVLAILCRINAGEDANDFAIGIDEESVALGVTARPE